MADASYLTIGKVVKKLQVQYPDLSVSKVRYLQDEGLLNPSRTPGGYRLYSQRDVRRLETCRRTASCPSRSSRRSWTASTLDRPPRPTCLARRPSF